MVTEQFTYPTYLVRRKFFRVLGAALHIFDPNGQVALYAQMKAFKLREDIRLYTGEDMKTEVLTIKARQVLDISATYDVVDPATGAKIGALRRKGLKSILRDEWLILDATDVQIGTIKEDSTALALIRRFLTNLVPQKFHAELHGKHVATYKQHFNPIIFKMDVDFTADTGGMLDKRIGLAAAVLLATIEGRQRS